MNIIVAVACDIELYPIECGGYFVPSTLLLFENIDELFYISRKSS